MSNGIFHIGWETSHLDVVVETFFADAAVPQFNKFLKLARMYSSEDDRMELLSAMSAEIDRRKVTLEETGKLRSEIAEKLWDYFATPGHGLTIEPTSLEKMLQKQIDKFTKFSEVIANERWS